MKGVILAAGRGQRLAPMGWDKPKCLLEFGRLTLLDNAVLSLTENGIRDIVIVLGYKDELVRAQMKNHDVNWQVVINENFVETNTINSLYLAGEYLDDDFIYFNADVLFDRRIVASLLPHQSSAFAIDVKSCGDEEVKVIVDEAGRITQIGKKLPGKKCMGEFIGVGKFARSACGDLKKTLHHFNETMGQRNLFFEAAVNEILADNVFAAVDIEDKLAIEIDSPDDYYQAVELWRSRSFDG